MKRLFFSFSLATALLFLGGCALPPEDSPSPYATKDEIHKPCEVISPWTAEQVHTDLQWILTRRKREGQIDW